MGRGPFDAEDCTRMICDFNPRKKILKALLESVDGKHSSGVCKEHEEVMVEWMHGRLEVVFPDGSPLKETDEEETKEMPPFVDDRCQKWRLSESA